MSRLEHGQLHSDLPTPSSRFYQVAQWHNNLKAKILSFLRLGFSVLIYYAITNLAAVNLTEDERIYPRLIPWVGLCSCIFLALWVQPMIWMTGLGLIAFGLVWHWRRQRNDRQLIMADHRQ